MLIYINGRSRLVSEGSNILYLIDILGMTPDTVIIECNGEAVSRTDFKTLPLKNGDKLEFIKIASGG